VFEKFNQFRELVEKQCDQPMKYLISDNRGEYVGKNFERYLSHNGIAWQRSIPYTVQQNDIAKRKKWTLVEMACVFL
jgi:hypothetical protein